MLGLKQLQELLRFQLAAKLVGNSGSFRKGSILIIVIWSLYLLTVFAVYLGFGAKQKILVTDNLGARAKLNYFAQAGIKKAIFELKKRDTTEGVDALKESWSTDESLFKDVPLGEGSYTISYVFFNKKDSQRRTRYGMIDEERKLNINKEKRAVIENLLKALGFKDMQAQNLSAAIVDWRDGDSQLSVPLGSAEDRFYKSLDDPYEAKDSDFETLDELLLVKGVDRGAFDKIKDFVTIYGEGKVNINTAPLEVLQALGLNKDVVDKILAFRAGEDKIEATADDYVFDSPSKIVPYLRKYFSLNDSEAAGLDNLISLGRITTESRNFMIRSRAQMEGRNSVSEIVCVFEKPRLNLTQPHLSDTGKIKYWREDLY